VISTILCFLVLFLMSQSIEFDEPPSKMALGLQAWLLIWSGWLWWQNSKRRDA
jgi:hypothetical protein